MNTTSHEHHATWRLISEPSLAWCRECHVHFDATPSPVSSRPMLTDHERDTIAELIDYTIHVIDHYGLGTKNGLEDGSPITISDGYRLEVLAATILLRRRGAQ